MPALARQRLAFVGRARRARARARPERARSRALAPRAALRRVRSRADRGASRAPAGTPATGRASRGRAGRSARSVCGSKRTLALRTWARSAPKSLSSVACVVTIAHAPTSSKRSSNADGQRRTGIGFGARADLVDEDQRARVGLRDDLGEPAQVRRKRRGVLRDRLLVADVGEDAREARRSSPTPPGRASRSRPSRRTARPS